MLASLYTGIIQPPPKKTEEKTQAPIPEKINAASDLSDEGKLKLFIGGLYFQSESIGKIIN